MSAWFWSAIAFAVIGIAGLVGFGMTSRSPDDWTGLSLGIVVLVLCEGIAVALAGIGWLVRVL